MDMFTYNSAKEYIERKYVIISIKTATLIGWKRMKKKVFSPQKEIPYSYPISIKK